MSSCSDNRCSSLIHLNGTNVWTEKEEGTSGSENWPYFGLPTFLVHELVMQTHICQDKKKKSNQTLYNMGLIWSEYLLTSCLRVSECTLRSCINKSKWEQRHAAVSRALMV